MKECGKCELKKELVEFSKDKTTKDGLNYQCKVCHKQSSKQYRLINPEYGKQYRESLKSKYTYLYLIPNPTTSLGYVGITNNLYFRMALHKHDGKDITNYEILNVFETWKEARKSEDYMHSVGYEGKRLYNTQK